MNAPSILTLQGLTGVLSYSGKLRIELPRAEAQIIMLWLANDRRVAITVKRGVYTLVITGHTERQMCRFNDLILQVEANGSYRVATRDTQKEEILRAIMKPAQ